MITYLDRVSFAQAAKDLTEVLHLNSVADLSGPLRRLHLPTPCSNPDGMARRCFRAAEDAHSHCHLVVAFHRIDWHGWTGVWLKLALGGALVLGADRDPLSLRIGERAHIQTLLGLCTTGCLQRARLGQGAV